MINLIENSTVGDNVAVAYSGPGFYSGRPKNALNSDIVLEKVSDEFYRKEDVYQFCKMNGYKVKPIRFKSCNDIPAHWEIFSDCNPISELYEDDV